MAERSTPRDPALARAAAADPNRPGEGCRAEPGTWMPVVDHAACEGKLACAKVCPHDVFEVTRIREEDWAAIGWFARLKVWAHGMQTAYTPRADACAACGLCVVACPERAIVLVRRGGPPEAGD